MGKQLYPVVPVPPAPSEPEDPTFRTWTESVTEELNSLSQSAVDARDFGVSAANEDNANSLREAIAKGSELTATVMLPTGQLKFGSTLTIDQRIRLQGVGPTRRWRFDNSGTELVATGNDINAMVVNSDTANDVLDGLEFKDFTLTTTSNVSNGLVLDAVTSNIDAIESCRLNNVHVSSFGSVGLQCKGTVFDLTCNHSSFVTNRHYGIHVDRTSAKQGNPSQFLLHDCFAEGTANVDSWGYLLDGNAMRMVGGTVVGRQNSSGVKFIDSGMMLGTNIEGVSGSSVGVRYRGNAGFQMVGGIVSGWSTGVEMGDPDLAAGSVDAWFVNGDITSNTTSLHIVAGGTRIGCIIQRGAASVFTYWDERADTDGVNNSWFIMSQDQSSFVTWPNGEYITSTSAGGVQFGGNLGFYSQAPIARPTVSGADTASVLTDLVSELSSLGLIVDGT